MNFFFWILSIATADPQEIPDESSDNSSKEEDTDNTEDTPNSDAENEISQEATHDSSDSPPLVEDPQTKESQPQKEDGFSEITKLSKELTNRNEEEEEFDISFLQGNILLSLDFHYWIEEQKTNYLPSVSFSGNPHYFWALSENIGPLLGLRFRKRGIEQIGQQVKDNLIGISTGLKIGAIDITTAGSYYTHHLFLQEESFKTTNEITYIYQELNESAGILWEQVVNFNPVDSDFFIEARFAFPFQIQGNREMGEPFRDSWRTNVNLGFSSWLIGYEYNLHPNNIEHILMLGSGFRL